MREKQLEIINALNVPSELCSNFGEELVNHIIEERTQFLKGFLEKFGLSGFVLGISGGVDSFVASMLAKKAGRLISISLPYSTQKDIEDVKKAVEVIKPDEFITHNIEAAVDAQMNEVLSHNIPLMSSLNVVKGNMMARERMAVQYSYASIYNCLVIGTDHATEAVTGFYTKYGDGAADITPLAGLTKDVIYKMAQILGAPDSIMKKAPSAGLWDGQTDEIELGLSYADLCDYLQGKEINEKVAEKIESVYNKTEHKRHMPVTISDSWWK